jgi:hypothetical protein
MKNKILIGIFILGIILISLVVILPLFFNIPFGREFFDRTLPPERAPWNEFRPYLVVAKIVLSSVNAILLTIVLAIYIGIYSKTKSQFSLGLVIFTIALLLYALTANPIIHWVTGFRASGLGPFTMLPDLFTCIASAMLLYLSRQ